jgi:hypothetical protein
MKVAWMMLISMLVALLPVVEALARPGVTP